ncbi:CobB/CobQ domain protein glutamine amidotransferase [[Leptolyngbya] sp. PCC 7376]|uniref:type 1 glutamine amidotransferase n=1 Tax=[Leptolyngbya] sp. PCC 7376 TaxID=111781 RepID=UPI00029EE969|nr:type 1 glutamine amidotransferase [[Leptolyngbya] sp. PCC 7376]AFY40116.1 CobB/CobQ domain protein glutamine amidotransferase [[Leptolyngbya] sp. PCC 7376]
MHLKLGWLYPTLMGTYGDRGNVICLEKRAQWRDIEVEIVALDQEAPLEAWSDIDLIVGGGAQDRQQEIVMRDLQGAKAAKFKSLIEDGVPGVFTCGSPQLLGKYYEPAVGQRIEGLGILDLVSKHPGFDAKRCIGNVAFEITANPLADDLAKKLGSKPVALGFENHGGRTYLGDVQPLGKVLTGYGNNGEDGWEGAFHKMAIATYAHGPLLPKNPFIADWLLEKALERKYDKTVEFSALDDQLATDARETMFNRLNLTELNTSA